MKSSILRVAGVAGAIALAGALLAGCTSTPAEPADGKVEITVGDLPSTADEASRTAFLDQVSKFEEANPNITVKAVEDKYDPTTFAAQLAGGTLPTGITVPLTEIQSLIARGQVKDLSSYYDSSDVLKALSPSTTASLTNDGKYFGVPTEAFTLSLIVNRSVLTAAGLDPDNVDLSSWDAVQKAAKQVTDKTDAAGLLFMTKDNLGGWLTTALTAAFGGQMQTQNSDGKWESTVDGPAVEKALSYLKTLRWQDDSLGANMLLGFPDGGAAFSSGQYGIMVGVPGWYGVFVNNNGMPKDDFGLFPLPQEADGLGSLGGGAVAIVRPDATDAQAAATVKWYESRYLAQFTDTATAKKLAEADKADGNPVPAVGLPLVSADKYQAYLDAIKPFINVPMEHLAPYTDATQSSDFHIVSEPPVEAQQIYALLDSVVQAVLTDQNADISALLKTAQAQAATIVTTAQG